VLCSGNVIKHKSRKRRTALAVQDGSTVVGTGFTSLSQSESFCEPVHACEGHGSGVALPATVGLKITLKVSLLVKESADKAHCLVPQAYHPVRRRHLGNLNILNIRIAGVFVNDRRVDLVPCPRCPKLKDVELTKNLGGLSLPVLSRNALGETAALLTIEMAAARRPTRLRRILGVESGLVSPRD